MRKYLRLFNRAAERTDTGFSHLLQVGPTATISRERWARRVDHNYAQMLKFGARDNVSMGHASRRPGWRIVGTKSWDQVTL